MGAFFTVFIRHGCFFPLPPLLLLLLLLILLLLLLLPHLLLLYSQFNLLSVGLVFTTSIKTPKKLKSLI